MLSKAFMGSAASTSSGDSVAAVKALVPASGMFPLTGFSGLRSVQDARRYLMATRSLLSPVRQSPSGTPVEVRLPLDDAWFHCNVGLSLIDSHIRLGRTWFDAIDDVPGLRSALNGMVRSFAHARPSWESWDKERNVVAAIDASMDKLAGGSSAFATGGSVVKATEKSTTKAALSSKALSGISDTLASPTPTSTYIGLGLATVAAMIFWSMSK
jgi:hypothetical protein